MTKNPLRPVVRPSSAVTEVLPWLQGCREGRPEAITELFRAHRPVVERLLRRLVGPTPDIEDLLQSTFVEVLRNLSRFRGEARIATWICGIAVNVAHHHLRAGKIRRHVPLEVVVHDESSAAVQVANDHRGAEYFIDNERLAIRLHRLLDRLTPKKRIALMLYVMEDKSVEEIAALMNATQTATRSRMYFARRELRKLILADRTLGDWTAVLFKSGERP